MKEMGHKRRGSRNKEYGLEVKEKYEEEKKYQEKGCGDNKKRRKRGRNTDIRERGRSRIITRRRRGWVCQGMNDGIIYSSWSEAPGVLTHPRLPSPAGGGRLLKESYGSI